jgi:hypothetical protein
MVALKKYRTDWLPEDTLILNNHNIKHILGLACAHLFRSIPANYKTVVAFVRQRLPAQAGTHAVHANRCSVFSMGFRLRGNDVLGSALK